MLFLSLLIHKSRGFLVDWRRGGRGAKQEVDYNKLHP